MVNDKVEYKDEKIKPICSLETWIAIIIITILLFGAVILYCNRDHFWTM